MGTVPWNLGARGGLSPDILGLRGLTSDILVFQWDHLLISWGSGALSPNILGLRGDHPQYFWAGGTIPRYFGGSRGTVPQYLGAERGPSLIFSGSGCTIRPPIFWDWGDCPLQHTSMCLGTRVGTVLTSQNTERPCALVSHDMEGEPGPHPSAPLAIGVL